MEVGALHMQTILRTLAEFQGTCISSLAPMSIGASLDAHYLCVGRAWSGALQKQVHVAEIVHVNLV